MAEEIKQEEKKECCKTMLPVIMKSIIGLALLVLGGLAIRAWWGDLLVLVRGSIGVFIILAGIITLAIAKE